MYTFCRIEAENFMSFRSLDLDLTKYKGITLISGERKGAGRSNGAGKSCILEAIYWTLFGSTIRKLTKANGVMYRFMKPDERTVVRLTMLVDGREVIIERGRSKSGPSLRILESGLENKSSTTDGVQDRIQRLIGKDSKTFLTTDLFSGQIAKFCSMTDSERKALLESMTGADRFHAAGKLADDRLREVTDKIRRLELLIQQHDLRLDQSLEEKQREIYRHVQASLLRHVNIANLRKASFKQVERTNEASDILATFYTENILKKSEFEAKKLKLELAISVSEEIETELRDAVAKIDTEAATHIAQANTFRTEIQRIKRNDRPDLCPQCGQVWPSTGPSKDHLEAEIQRLTKQLAKELAISEPLAAKKQGIQGEITTVVQSKRKSQALLRAMEDERDNRKERALLSAYIAEEANLTHAHKALVKALEEMPEDGEFNADTSDIDARVAKMKAEKQAAVEELTVAKVHASRLEFWKTGFGRGGLPSMLLDSSVPSMNETVARVASALSDGELNVSFDPAAAKGKGDAFAVNVTYADGGEGYDLVSRGEHTRTDLAVLFALRDLVEKRGSNRCTQLFLDEVMDGCDAAFCESFIKMLRTEFAEKSVFVISHDDSIKSECSNSIIVRKTGNAAKIVS